MKKVYVKKIGNKEGKELFMGQPYTKILYNVKDANLIGDIDNKSEFDMFSYQTERYLAFGLRKSEQNAYTVDEKTKGAFIIVK